MKLKLIGSANIRKVTRAMSVDHRGLFQAMGMRKNPNWESRDYMARTRK